MADTSSVRMLGVTDPTELTDPELRQQMYAECAFILDLKPKHYVLDYIKVMQHDVGDESRRNYCIDAGWKPTTKLPVDRRLLRVYRALHSRHGNVFEVRTYLPSSPMTVSTITGGDNRDRVVAYLHECLAH